MIIVHHLDDSRSQRIPWLLKELGVPYESKAAFCQFRAFQAADRSASAAEGSIGPSRSAAVV
jgi:glutathione S-transferase